MAYDDQDWAIFGSISSETRICVARGSARGDSHRQLGLDRSDDSGDLYSVYFTDVQDDRVQCLTLARRIFTELGSSAWRSCA